MTENVATPQKLASLSAEDAAALRLAQRAVNDAARRADVAAAKAKVEIGEAMEVLVELERRLAAAHGYDPDQPARLVGCELFAEAAR